jgi:predicted nucleotidyltransferase
LIELVIAHYRGDARVRAIVVFGSVSTGTWHDLSDVDLDVVTEDGAVIEPASEATALFGPRAVIILPRTDSVDVVLDSLEEVSIRWHPLAATSPNICASAQVVAGDLSTAEIVAAGDGNRVQPDEQQLLDAFVRDAVYAGKRSTERTDGMRSRPYNACASPWWACAVGATACASTQPTRPVHSAR